MKVLPEPVTPPLLVVGSSVRSGDATKLLWSSSSARRGSTWIGTSHCSHDELAHCVIGLMQSGHCSAPNTTEPVGAPELLFEFELLPDLLLDPHAAKISASAVATTEMRTNGLRRQLHRSSSVHAFCGDLRPQTTAVTPR